MLIFIKMVLKLFFFLLGTKKLSNIKKIKKIKNKQIILDAGWHATRWWDRCVAEDEKKEAEPLFIDEK